MLEGGASVDVDLRATQGAIYGDGGGGLGVALRDSVTPGGEER